MGSHFWEGARAMTFLMINPTNHFMAFPFDKLFNISLVFHLVLADA